MRRRVRFVPLAAMGPIKCDCFYFLSNRLNTFVCPTKVGTMQTINEWSEAGSDFKAMTWAESSQSPRLKPS